MASGFGDCDRVFADFHQFPLLTTPRGPNSPEDKDYDNRPQGGLDHPGLGVPAHEIEHAS